jgi:hypothetical protein
MGANVCNIGKTFFKAIFSLTDKRCGFGGMLVWFCAVRLPTPTGLGDMGYFGVVLTERK